MPEPELPQVQAQGQVRAQAQEQVLQQARAQAQEQVLQQARAQAQEQVLQQARAQAQQLPLVRHVLLRLFHGGCALSEPGRHMLRVRRVEVPETETELYEVPEREQPRCARLSARVGYFPPASTPPMYPRL